MGLRESKMESEKFDVRNLSNKVFLISQPDILTQLTEPETVAIWAVL